MAVKRLSIVLTEQEGEILMAAAARECRRPQDQARYLLRLALGLADRSEENANRGAVDPEQAHAATSA